jgi:phytol kinase
MNPLLATVLTLIAALAWLRIMDFAAHQGWIESRLSRKIIHIGTGPIFVLCWLMYPGLWYDRYLAALVPGLITVQFALIGLGIIKDEASVKAMSRTGDPKEILRGPLYYGIMFVLLTILFWKDNPIGMTALMMMCGGDGIADVVGRRIQSPKLAWSSEKSIAGTLSVFVGGVLFSLFILGVYVALSIFPGPFSNYLLPILVIGLVSMAVESLPHKDVDNITMTLAAAITGWFLF